MVTYSGFDAQQPPPQQVMDTCVHCGFCLSTCPSYRVIGKETDSPRGRIYLMNAIAQGEATLSPATVQHFDSCLGCLACVSTCPSGVQYDQLISATRPQVERHHDRPPLEQSLRWLIFNLFPYPQRLKKFLPALWLYQRSGLRSLVRKVGILKAIPTLEAMESVLPDVDLGVKPFPRVVAAQGEKRYRVGMILGCVQQLFFDPVNRATLEVLTANGCEVVIPGDQGCCSALPAHQGQEEQAKTLARQMIDRFADTGVDYIIINAAGCGHTLKEYGHLLAGDAYAQVAKDFTAKVRDVQEFLWEVGLTADLKPISTEPLPVVYQDACHLLHGQKIYSPPRRLLQQIPGVQLFEPVDAALCCGSAGVYNLLQPETAMELGRQKVQNLTATGAQVIASPNPGCALQIQKHLQLQGKTVPVFHPMELLARSIAGRPV